MSRRLILPLILISVLLVAEIFSYVAIRAYFQTNSQISLKKFTWIWWGLTVLIYVSVFTSRSLNSMYLSHVLVNVFFFLLICKLFVGLFFLGSQLILFLKDLFIQKDAGEEFIQSRRSLISKLALTSALIPFSTLTYGLFRTAYHFKIHRNKVRSSKIPKSFSGFRIVQISDIHTGSLQNEHQLQKAIDMVMELKADLIVFTGDLVNNRTEEAYPYEHVLRQLKAPYGVYSTLGNHDYGDYEQWKSKEAKDQNMRDMIDLHHKLGWKLMLNEHVHIEKDGEHFCLIGIENWGGNLHFKRYGDLPKAYQNVDSEQFQILLSHDPSHWSIEVLEDFPKVDLTLSGHTHGFQFGVEIPGFKWSPSKYFYPQWAGLYEKNGQQLYVNRGLGCLGYMGRIGIRPEITLLELSPA
ncbi:MAG: metallophosphoesterase [Bacteroidetes bacterium]|nr:MAG: metallophosphoesterase [Bacteroidota bacterium]